MYERSKLALRLEGVFSKKAKENISRGGGSGDSGRQKSDKPIDTKRELAKVSGVSHDTISKVKKIEQRAPEASNTRGRRRK